MFFDPDNIDEIIFRYRNKDYGAYYMRKKYTSYLFIAIIIAITVFVTTSLFPYLFIKKPVTEISEGALYSEYLVPPPDNTKKPEDDLLPKLKKIQQKAKFDIPQITANAEEITDDFSTESRPGDSASDGNSSTGSREGTLNAGDGNPDAVYTYVEEPPIFPGGENARMMFLRNNIKYPQLALQNKIQGKVYISFIVEKDGSLSNIKVLQGIGAGCDEEALRVMRLMPKWKPGKTQGHPVRVVISMPINFILQIGKT